MITESDEKAIKEVYARREVEFKRALESLKLAIDSAKAMAVEAKSPELVARTQNYEDIYKTQLRYFGQFKEAVKKSDWYEVGRNVNIISELSLMLAEDSREYYKKVGK
jgi:hypothetical protein